MRITVALASGVVALVGLSSVGCEWINMRHEKTILEVNKNTDRDTEKVAQAVQAAAPEDKQEAVAKVRAEMRKEIEAAQQQTQERLDAAKAQFEQNFGAITGLAQAFGVPAGVLNLASGLALGNSINGKVTKVETDSKTRSDAIEESVTKTNEKVAKVKETADKAATDLAAYLSTNSELKQKFEALSAELQKRIVEVRSSLTSEAKAELVTKASEILKSGDGKEMVDKRIEELLVKAGFSKAELDELKKGGLDWQSVLLLLAGGGVIGTGGGALAGKKVARPQDTEVDELYEKLNALQTALAGAGLRVDNGAPPVSRADAVVSSPAVSVVPGATPGSMTINIAAGCEPQVQAPSSGNEGPGKKSG